MRRYQAVEPHRTLLVFVRLRARVHENREKVNRDVGTSLSSNMKKADFAPGCLFICQVRWY